MVATMWVGVDGRRRRVVVSNENGNWGKRWEEREAFGGGATKGICEISPAVHGASGTVWLS